MEQSPSEEPQQPKKNNSAKYKIGGAIAAGAVLAGVAFDALNSLRHNTSQPRPGTGSERQMPSEIGVNLPEYQKYDKAKVPSDEELQRRLSTITSSLETTLTPEVYKSLFTYNDKGEIVPIEKLSTMDKAQLYATLYGGGESPNKVIKDGYLRQEFKEANGTLIGQDKFDTGYELKLGIFDKEWGNDFDPPISQFQMQLLLEFNSEARTKELEQKKLKPVEVGKDPTIGRQIIRIGSDQMNDTRSLADISNIGQSLTRYDFSDVENDLRYQNSSDGRNVVTSIKVISGQPVINIATTQPLDRIP